MADKRTVTIKFLGDASSFQKTAGIVDKEGGKLGGTFSKMSGALKVAGIGLATGALAALPGLQRAGAELESMGAKAATVFGGSLGQVEKWASTNANAMGATRREAVGLAANFADLLVPMGFTQKQAADMSTKVVGLSGALSAWSNGTRTAAEVSTILSKAMLGERDGLKELGISISDADVKARLLANGQDKLTGAALQQATAQATQQLIFEKSTDAQKAFADSTKTSTERNLEAKARMNELKDALAVGLVPAFAKATDVGLGVVDFLTNLSPTAQTAIGVVAGLAAAAFVVVKAVQAWTAVQAALNVVMSMNPIGLIVIAIAALVAGLILAYNKVGWFRDGINSLIGVGKAVAGVYAKIFDGMWTAAKTVFNSVARAWNSTVGKLSFKVPGWVPGLGGKGWEVPNIPMLAAGGVVSARPGGTLALLGEGGHDEAVVPLSGPNAPSFGGGGGSTVVRVTVQGNVYATGGERQFAEQIATHIQGALLRMKQDGRTLGLA